MSEETNRDIVAEMRSHERGEAKDAFYTRKSWRDLCDRLEAAERRDAAENCGRTRTGNARKPCKRTLKHRNGRRTEMEAKETITPAYRWQLVKKAVDEIVINLVNLDVTGEVAALGRNDKKIVADVLRRINALRLVATIRVAALCPAANDETVAHPAANGADAEGKED